MVNYGIRADLKRAVKAYQASNGKDVDLVDRWDRFFRQTKDGMAATGQRFVTRVIRDMRTRWTNELEARIGRNTRAQKTRDRLDELQGHFGDIFMDDLHLEQLD
ncbi:hypothetical protein PEBR_31875 [Penicillium brasilianum]|uniref:Uncharacterized protein n=1 Tax=Penicillium brasilianum TaxID=104259 RepID=A0A1S9RF01_PENBI|nr:hypothetical protein PEBR_31875 [Penicillium brasilianum]